MNISTWVDAFVEKVNATLLCFDDVPDSERIARENRRALVEELEEKLPCRWPKSFRDLLCRYAFPPFECADIAFFAWSDDAQYAHYDLRHAVFNDEALSRVLLTNGFIQFGRPDTGSYDAICFDTNRKIGDNEYSIVCIEHENALMYERIVADTIAPSFADLMRNFGEKVGA